MTRPISGPSNSLLSAGLAERTIPLEVRAVHELRTTAKAGAWARIGSFAGYSGRAIEHFADSQGRKRELLVYLLERAARHQRTWRVRGFYGTLYVPLGAQEMEDRTLATSFDIIAKSQSIDPSAFTAVIPLKDYLVKYEEVAGAIARLRRVGCGLAMSIDCNHIMKFTPIPDQPFTALVLGGKDVWKRMRTVGPGKLGALGSWIGWSESLGLERMAAGIAQPADLDTARLYGFGHGEGPHFSDFVVAYDFIKERQSQRLDLPALTEQVERFAAQSAAGSALARTASDPDLRLGLPPRPETYLKRG